MQKPKILENEKKRQAALDSYNITNTPPEQSFDDLTLIASQICDTPIALVSLIDNNRQWFKSKFGLEVVETHRDISFCGHAINEPNKIFEIQDAKNDLRFADNPLVTGDLNIGFYAGVPIVDSSNFALGTLCVIDKKPRILSDNQKKALEAVAREVMNKIQLRSNNQLLNSKIDSTEEELSESRIKYSKLYNESPDMMVSVDPYSKTIANCNETLCERLDYSQEELIGSSLFEMLHSDCHEELKLALKEFVENGIVTNKRFILRKKDGGKINVAVNIKAVRDEKGEILYSNSVIRDIDELVQAEEKLIGLNADLEKEVIKRTGQLSASKERLQLALEGTNDAVIDWTNIHNDYLWWSLRFNKMLGYEKGELQYSKQVFIQQLVHPEDVMETAKNINKCLEKDIPFDVEFRLKTKEGKYKWCRGRGNGVKNEVGEIVRMAGSISDIDEQKKLELELFKTKDFLKKIMDIAPSIIYVFNQRTMSNEFANREIGSVLGYSVKEIQELGAQFMPDLCHPDDLGRIFQHMTEISQLKDQDSAVIEYRMRHKDGEYRWLHSEDTVFERDQDDAVISQLGVATDITKLKQIQEKLSKQANTLKLQNQDLKQFAYVATHDLKSPMVTLKGHFNFLKNQFVEPSEDILESIEFVEEEIKNFNLTLEGLNEAIKLKEVEIEKEPVNLKKVIQQLEPSYRGQIDALGGEISFNLADESLIKGNLVYVRSIVNNLITNAIKYRSQTDKTKIKISTEIVKNYLYFKVEDNGLGIDLSLQKTKLFKMFNRFHDVSEGSGMGLYLVKSMVDKLGGKIEFESEVNKGTTVKIYFKRIK